MEKIKEDLKKLSSLSIILPCYNEEKNIKTMVLAAENISKKIAKDFEILVINDGSTDKTEKIALKLSDKIKQLKVITQENQGYGGALKTGFKNTSKDWIFFTDADLQFNLNELLKFLSHTDNFDFIFGYRINRADGFYRLLIAKMLKIWNKLWLNFPLNIKDIDCAFKLMKRKSFESIGPIYSSGAMISTEFILKINKKGYKIKQIGVKHYPRIYGHSTGSNFKVIWKAIQDTFVLRKLLSTRE